MWSEEVAADLKCLKPAWEDDRKLQRQLRQGMTVFEYGLIDPVGRSLLGGIPENWGVKWDGHQLVLIACDFTKAEEGN